MTEEKKYNIFTENRGKFTIVTKDKKVYHWEFPGITSLGENYDVINFLHEEMWNALQEQREETKKKTEEKPEKIEPEEKK